jgi:hypothetical protein
MHVSNVVPFKTVSFKIRFLGHIYGIDVDARQVQISWSVVGCGDGFVFNGTTGILGVNNCGSLSRAIDIYVDGYGSHLPS